MVVVFVVAVVAGLVVAGFCVVVPESLAVVVAGLAVLLLVVAGLAAVFPAGLFVVPVPVDGFAVVPVPLEAGFAVLPVTGLVPVDPVGLGAVTVGFAAVVDAGFVADGVPDGLGVLTAGFAAVVTGFVTAAGFCVFPASARRIGAVTAAIVESIAVSIVGAPIGVYTSVTHAEGLRVWSLPLAYTSIYWPVVFSCNIFWLICLLVASHTLGICE